jgi:hypothetical protein
MASISTATSSNALPVETPTSRDVTDNVKLAIGAAAAASAIFAPLSYGWKGVLTAVAAESILGGIYGYTPFRKLFRF